MDSRESWETYYSREGRTWKESAVPLPGIKEGSRVLVVGCGTGSTVIGLAERKMKVVGIDFSENALSITKDRIGKRGLEAELIMMDVREGCWESGYDAVVIHHVLSGMKRSDRSKAAAKCIEALRSGGILSFFDFAVSDMRYGSGTEIEENTFLNKVGLITHFFKKEEVRNLFPDLIERKLETISWKQRVGPSTGTRSRIKAVFLKP